MNHLIENIDKLHTTKLGAERIKKNLHLEAHLEAEDVVQWCRERILEKDAVIEKSGKNWYINVGGCRITVNSYSYTIITAHMGE